MIHSILIFTLSGIPLYQKHFTSRQHHYDSSHHSKYANAHSSLSSSLGSENHSSHQPPPISMLQALITSMWRTAWNLRKNTHLTHMQFENMSITMKVDTNFGLICVLFHGDEGAQTYEFCYLLAGEILQDFIHTILENRKRFSGELGGGGTMTDEDGPEDVNVENETGNNIELQGSDFHEQNNNIGPLRGTNGIRGDQSRPEIHAGHGRQSSYVSAQTRHSIESSLSFQSLQSNLSTQSNHSMTSYHDTVSIQSEDGTSIPNATQNTNITTQVHIIPQKLQQNQQEEAPQKTERPTIKSITTEEQNIVNERFFKVCNNLRDKLIRNSIRKQPGCISAFLIDTRESGVYFEESDSEREDILDDIFERGFSYNTENFIDTESFDISANLNILISQAKDVMHEYIDEAVQIQIRLNDEFVHQIAKISSCIYLVVKYQENRSKFLKKHIEETITILRLIYKLRH